MSKETKPRLRCVIYTRKSSEEGLDMEFNSLDAQREACEAYIASQKAEGWDLVPTRYDDGGFSGGTLDRPALKRLMDDIAAGKIDSVVVYKIDRLSRSLMDFVKMVEVFERHHVTFVSITQSFNTTTSMDRLMLNILLSFAQFEREVIGERIRDKFAASRRKGMWMGGSPPLGYNVENRKLVINPEEAKIVRSIFEFFTRTGSNVHVVREMRKAKIMTKSWTTLSGKRHEGHKIDAQYIHRILRNRVYLGEAVHKGKAYPGEHKPIVDKSLWDEAHRILSVSYGKRANTNRCRTPAILRGLVRCACCGSAMTPSSSNVRARGVSYRYYVCLRALREGSEACSIRSIPAGELELAVMFQIQQAFSAPELIAAIGKHLKLRDEQMAALGASEREDVVREKLQDFDVLWNQLFVQEQQKFLAELIDRIEVGLDGVKLHLKKNGLTQWIAGERDGSRDDCYSSAA